MSRDDSNLRCTLRAAYCNCLNFIASPNNTGVARQGRIYVGFLKGGWGLSQEHAESIDGEGGMCGGGVPSTQAGAGVREGAMPLLRKILEFCLWKCYNLVHFYALLNKISICSTAD